MPNDLFPPVAFYFAVRFSARGANDDCSFREVSGIGPELETEAVTEGGENRFVYQLPKAVKHPRLVLKRGVAPRQSRLVEWCIAVLEGGLVKKIVPEQIEVRLLDQSGQPLRAWSFQRAFPVKWEIEPFQSTKNELAMEKVELSYAYSTRGKV